VRDLGGSVKRVTLGRPLPLVAQRLARPHHGNGGLRQLGNFHGLFLPPYPVLARYLRDCVGKRAGEKAIEVHVETARGRQSPMTRGGGVQKRPACVDARSPSCVWPHERAHLDYRSILRSYACLLSLGSHRLHQMEETRPPLLSRGSPPFPLATCSSRLMRIPYRIHANLCLG
jgi:hypothetical protein